MFRVRKALNHNTLIAISSENHQEYLLIGKGIGFGKKVSERFDIPEGSECTIYSLHEQTERGKAMEIIKGIEPIYLEVAGQILAKSETVFGKIDKKILFPMADHIAFAVQRIRAGESISNPMTSDIRSLFYVEYKTAECIKEILKETLNVEIDEDEIGYIALHIHSAIDDQNVSLSMQMAMSVHQCIQTIEEETNHKIDVESLSYNRLMNHIKYMIARVLRGEKLNLNMNEYMSNRFPTSYQIAADVCEQIKKQLSYSDFDEAEVGYLAMHIERVLADHK